jgi:hypothetical protein
VNIQKRRRLNQLFGIEHPVHPVDEARVRARLKDWDEKNILRALDCLRQYGPFDQALILTGMKA